MDSIPKFLASLITIIIAVLVFVSFIISSVIVTSARTYHSSVIEEVEAGDFHTSVLEKCIEAAQNDGYSLSIEALSSTENSPRQLFKVTLGYKLSAPIFGNIIEGSIIGYTGIGGQIADPSEDIS